VETKLTQALERLGYGILPPERTTIADYLTWWLENVIKPTRRPKTYRTYEQQVRLHLIPALGRVELAKLTRQHVQTLLRQKQESGLSNRSVQIIHAVLRHALEEAVLSELIARNVAKLVKPPAAVRPEIRPLDHERARRLLASLRGDRLEALFLLALTTGMRQGEILGLRWHDVDLDAATLTVRWQLQWSNGAFQFVPPKTKRSYRVIELPPLVVDALRTHRARQQLERDRAGAAWHDLDLVFATRNGSPIFGWNIYREFKTRAKRAGLEHVRFHDLRHSCASLLLAEGVDMRTVMEILGHSQIAITIDTYSHVLPHTKREAARRMNALLIRLEPTAADDTA
jgi:integrase